MAKIFIDYNHKDYQIFDELSSCLKDDKHDVFSFDKNTFKSFNAYFDKVINNTDVIIFLISSDSLNSMSFMNSFSQLRNYVTHSNDKLLIPVLLPNVDFNIIPTSLRNIPFIRIKSIDKEEIKILAGTINKDINRFIGELYAKKEKAQKFKKIVDSTASKYISETLDRLNDKEKKLNNTGKIWNIIGFISIILGIVLMILTQIRNYTTSNEIISILIVSIKNLILIALLIAASKYAFNLSRLYMNESLKISNRIHAISFGEFYLKVNQNIEPNELKEIFSNWNININSAFLESKLDDYDPNLIDKLSKLFKEIKTTPNTA